jgi:hypothetical protein
MGLPAERRGGLSSPSSTPQRYTNAETDNMEKSGSAEERSRIEGCLFVVKNFVG